MVSAFSVNIEGSLQRVEHIPRFLIYETMGGTGNTELENESINFDVVF